MYFNNLFSLGRGDNFYCLKFNYTFSTNIIILVICKIQRVKIEKDWFLYDNGLRHKRVKHS